MINKENSYTEMSLSDFYSKLGNCDYDCNASTCSDNILYIPGNVNLDDLSYQCRYLFRKDDDFKLSIIELNNII
jgi:hypothetical protein